MSVIIREFVKIVFIILLITSATGSAFAEDIRIIVRGDDLGMTEGSLEAFEQCMNNGILTTASVLVPAPWFEAAAELCRNNPGWCTGVHLCLVGEWRGYRWRPVLPWGDVPSIVDEDGYLYTSPDELYSHNPKIEEIESELRAQIKLAKKKGINIQYIDNHYGAVTVRDDGKKLIQRLSRDYDLPISNSFEEKRGPYLYRTPLGTKIDEAVKVLDSLKPGLYLWVVHPGIASPEQFALIHSLPAHVLGGGGVGKHRAGETEAITSIEVKSAILRNEIILTDYKKLWEEKKR